MLLVIPWGMLDRYYSFYCAPCVFQVLRDVLSVLPVFPFVLQCSRYCLCCCFRILTRYDLCCVAGMLYTLCEELVLSCVCVSMLGIKAA